MNVKVHTEHADDCGYCSAGEGMVHTYEPSFLDDLKKAEAEVVALLAEIPWRF